MVSDGQLLDDLREFAKELGKTPTSWQMRNTGPRSVSTYETHFGSWNKALKASSLQVSREMDIPKEQLLDDLCEFAKELGETPTRKQMRNSGPRSSTTYEDRFGSWNDALQAVGLKTNLEIDIPKEQLLNDLREFADELGGTPTQKQMGNLGPYSVNTYHNHFGSWNKALKAAGLEINNEKPSIESKEQLLDDLREFAKELGETPTQQQMNKTGPWSVKAYRNLFNSWNEALKASGLQVNCLANVERAGTGEDYYGRNYLQKRAETYERDNYECRVCDEDELIHCHHIKPRRTFDDVNKSNTLDNLVILCASCHCKYEGRWQDATPDEFVEKAKS